MEQAIVVRPVMDAPLVTASQAKAMWQEYQELEQAILTDDDYLWFVEYEYTQNNRRRIGRVTCPNRAAARTEQQKRVGSNISKRKVKSACRKMGKFFGLEIPDAGNGHIETRVEGDYLVQVERGDFYTITEWLGKLPDRNGEIQALRTIKASAVIFIRSTSDRTWLGKGGAHYSEGFEDFAVAETAFTRAVNRAVLDFVGYGDESAEDTAGDEPIPGDTPAAEPAPAKSNRTKYQELRKDVTDLATSLELTRDFMTAYFQNTFKQDTLAKLTLPQLTDTLKYLNGVQRQRQEAQAQTEEGSTAPVDEGPPPPEEEPDPDWVALGPSEGERPPQTEGPPPPEGDEPPLTREQEIEAIHSYAQTIGFDNPHHIPIILKMEIPEWLDSGKTVDDAIALIDEMADKQRSHQ